MLDIFPLVSVIVTTHERPDFLKRTILSILSQTYQNLQIIIVSNGANQDNKRVVSCLKDPRIEYYEQENSGTPASPRNTGIGYAKGEYIAFCDDDDLWMSSKVEKQVSVLNSNLEYDACFSKMIRFDNIREWTVSIEEGPANFNSLLYTNTIPISSLMLRKNIIDINGGFLESKNVGVSADYELALRYSLKTKFYFINEYLIKYWSGENRTTLLDPSKNIRAPFRYIKTILNIYLIIYKKSNTSLFTYIGPAIFNIKNTLKVILYIAIKRLGLR